jgi:hypothetical protein
VESRIDPGLEVEEEDEGYTDVYNNVANSEINVN